MKNRIIILLGIITIFSPLYSVIAQESDSIRVYWLAPVQVTGQRENWNAVKTGIERERITESISTNGFSFIRKGVFFAQDLYADGLKKGDINVVIDGERYPNACPNRMDSPVTRVNPLEIDAISLSKTGANCQAGFGGLVQFQRAEAGDEMGIKGGISQTAGSLISTDAAFLFQAYQNRLSVRYATGDSYLNGDGKSFQDLYGYSQDPRYQLGEVAIRGNGENFKYGAAVSITRDIQFPYLRMDERTNDLYSGYLSYKGNKLYINHTSHLMDNAFRSDGMVMVTDATNMTIGLSGDFYEAYYRNWDSENFLEKEGMFHIDNHMIPDLKQYSAALNHQIKTAGFVFSGKLGLINTGINDAERLAFYQTLYSDAEDNRTFINASIGGSYHFNLSEKVRMGMMLEVVSEAPDAEYLYISVQKPMGKAWWSGNPTLDQPLRTTARMEMDYSGLNFEMFASRVWSYVYLDKVVSGMTPYLTYQNVDALMLGFNLTGNWEMLELNAFYTWAENLETETPLAEIPPLHLSAKVKSPVSWPIEAFVRGVWESEQTRIDDFLNETATPSWYHIDLGIGYTWEKLNFGLEIENITNENYYQHLSYLRDPFSSGFQVYDPGRIIRFKIMYVGLN